MIWKLLHNMRWVLLAITLIVIVLCLPYAKELRTDPSNQAVFTKDEAYKQNILFQETFGSDDTVVIGLGDTLILTESVLRWIELLTKELLKQDSILTVQSITNVPRIDREILKVTSENIAKQYLEGAETLEAYTRKLRDSSELSDHLLNRNGDFTILIASLKNNLSSNNRKEAIDLITKWVSNFPPPTGQVYYSGTAVEQARFIEKIQRDHDLFCADYFYSDYDDIVFFIRFFGRASLSGYRDCHKSYYDADLYGFSRSFFKYDDGVSGTGDSDCGGGATWFIFSLIQDMWGLALMRLKR
jgi:predicted RND superfamily exporter protein